MWDKPDYKQLYTLHYRKLYNYGKKFTSDTTIIEDSIQDVFLDYWKRSGQLIQPQALHSYFFSAFRYSLFAKIAREKKRGLLEIAAEPDFSAEHVMIQQEVSDEIRRKIQQALLQLTSRQREALFLRFYEGLSYEEIAGIMHITTKGMYKLVARSLLKLKNTLTLPLLLLLWQSVLAGREQF